MFREDLVAGVSIRREAVSAGPSESKPDHTAMFQVDGVLSFRAGHVRQVEGLRRATIGSVNVDFRLQGRMVAQALMRKSHPVRRVPN